MRAVAGLVGIILLTAYVMAYATNVILHTFFGFTLAEAMGL